MCRAKCSAKEARNASSYGSRGQIDVPSKGRGRLTSIVAQAVEYALVDGIQRHRLPHMAIITLRDVTPKRAADEHTRASWTRIVLCCIELPPFRMRVWDPAGLGPRLITDRFQGETYMQCAAPNLPPP